MHFVSMDSCLPYLQPYTRSYGVTRAPLYQFSCKITSTVKYQPFLLNMRSLARVSSSMANLELQNDYVRVSRTNTHNVRARLHGILSQNSPLSLNSINFYLAKVTIC